MPILEEIPESSTQWSDAPSNMAIIDRSSNVNIVGSHLNNVLGSQHNNIYHGNVTVHQTNSKPEERELTIWDEVKSISKRLGVLQVLNGILIAINGRSVDGGTLTLNAPLTQRVSGIRNIYTLDTAVLTLQRLGGYLLA
ncbi:hypothetical protein VNI00_009107 [Paramarasmius palmivorus]|uniref:Uncharacterized protein n=1 Tax=Paramarasmius palmivorus TaxID=297713 RepID=A0AAW0CSG6_9AGAR